MDRKKYLIINADAIKKEEKEKKALLLKEQKEH